MISTLDFTIPFNTPLYRILAFFSISILYQTLLKQNNFPCNFSNKCYNKYRKRCCDNNTPQSRL